MEYFKRKSLPVVWYLFISFHPRDFSTVVQICLTSPIRNNSPFSYKLNTRHFYTPSLYTPITHLPLTNVCLLGRSCFRGSYGFRVPPPVIPTSSQSRPSFNLVINGSGLSVTLLPVRSLSSLLFYVFSDSLENKMRGTLTFG